MRRHIVTYTGLVGLGFLLLAACQDDTRPAANTPEIVRFAVSPTNIVAGERATYSWKFNGDPGAVCALDIGSDGEAEYTLDCSALTQAHTFDAPGSFPATLTATVNGQSGSHNAPVVTAESGSVDRDKPGEGAEVDINTFTKIQWRPTTPLKFSLSESQSETVGDKFYVFGGFDGLSPYPCCRPTDRTFSFDPDTETWERLAPLPPMNNTKFGGVNHSGFVTDGENIYFAGGYTSNTSYTQHRFGTQEAWRYNVADDFYTRLPDMPDVRGSGELEYHDGKLYFFGGSGHRRKPDTGNLFILDLASGAKKWREGAPLPNPRNHLASVTLNGKIYAIAGQHKHDGNLTTQADVHRYDPETDIWEQVASLPKAVSHHTHATFVVGERIIVMGGEVAHLKAVANVYAYDPKTDVWSELTPMPVATVSPVARWVDGKIIFARKKQAWIGTPVR